MIAFRPPFNQPRSQGVLLSYADHETTLVHCDQKCSENGQICSHYGLHGSLGNADRRKMAVALSPNSAEYEPRN